ncbi:uncharacterized protein LOC141655258 [Silene latifolia]|uniref:uncharacterized protein LOC141655258 n=1 Tax=Silene latifolia TaxID=37657 RepID=UPI003D784F82
MLRKSHGAFMAGDEVIEWNSQSNENEQKRTSLLLVGKLWSSKRVNVKAAINTMCGLWSTKDSVVGKVVDVQAKIFVFQFEEKCDKERVLEGQPWHFDGFVWCFNEPNPNGKVSEVSLVHVPHWVRIFDLPLQGRSNIENARQIGNVLGGFLELDSSLYPELAMRIRVLHDVRVPLKKDIAIRMNGECVSKFPVKYERLPTFCYGCGVLGHGVRNCEKGPFEEGTYEFGPWNAVSSRKTVKKQEKPKKEEEDIQSMVEKLRIGSL